MAAAGAWRPAGVAVGPAVRPPVVVARGSGRERGGAVGEGAEALAGVVTGQADELADGLPHTLVERHERRGQLVRLEELLGRLVDLPALGVRPTEVDEQAGPRPQGRAAGSTRPARSTAMPASPRSTATATAVRHLGGPEAGVVLGGRRAARPRCRPACRARRRGRGRCRGDRARCPARPRRRRRWPRGGATRRRGRSPGRRPRRRRAGRPGERPGRRGRVTGHGRPARTARRPRTPPPAGTGPRRRRAGRPPPRPPACLAPPPPTPGRPRGPS